MTWDEVIQKLLKAEGDVVPDFGDDVEGMYWHRGRIRYCCGAEVEAWILKSWLDSGEQFGAVWRDGKHWIAQDQIDWSKVPKRTKKMVFPYKYRLNVQCPGDIHQSEMY